MGLPREVIAEDAKLDAIRDQSGLEFMRLRWHSTICEANDQRVTGLEYAKAIGCKEATMRKDAKGYEPLLAAQAAS